MADVNRGKWKGSRASLLRALQQLPALLAGRLHDPTGEVRRLYVRLGLVALSVIRASFVVKARGGTDAAGLKWAPLAPSTVRARLRKAKLPTERQARRELEAAYEVLARTSRGHKRLERAKAKADKVFNPKLEILRDTGRLLMSLSPAVMGAQVPGVPVAPPENAGEMLPQGSGDRVFRLRPGFVDVGTNVVYAPTHHHGRRPVPRRPLWAEWSRWPPEWRDLFHGELARGVARLVAALVARGRRS